MLAKLYLLDGGYSSLDPIPSSEIAKLVVKKCSLGAPAGDFALSLTARLSLRLFSLLGKGIGYAYFHGTLSPCRCRSR